MTIFCQSKDKSISPDIYLSVAPFWQWKLQLFESRAWAQAGHKTWKLPNVLHHPKMPRSNGTNWVPGHEVSTLHKPDFGVLVRLQDDLEAATNVPLVDSGHSDYLFESSRHPLLPRKNTYDLRGKVHQCTFLKWTCTQYKGRPPRLPHWTCPSSDPHRWSSWTRGWLGPQWSWASWSCHLIKKPPV